MDGIKNNNVHYNKGLVLTSRVFLPLLCAAATYKNVCNYFIFLAPALETFFVFIYTVITFLLLVLYPILTFISLINIKNSRVKSLKPAIIIPICVLINIVYVMLCVGDIEIITRSYLMSAASGTNDHQGYYFAQINTWFGNMSLVLALGLFIRDKKHIVQCSMATIAVLVIPTVLMVIIHPSCLGIRQSSFGESEVNFGGGLWNIGVMGFGSISWLALALQKYATKKQLNFMLFSMVIFVFVGVAGLSRTLILMVALSSICYFLLAKKDAHWIGRIFLILLAVGLFCILNTDILLSIISRFTDRSSGSKNIRFLLWDAYSSHFAEYWLLGAPEGSVYNYYRDVNLSGKYFLPHSAILNFLCRFGIVACLSYLCLIKNAFLSIKRTRENENTRICMLAGCVSYITLAFINQTGYAEAVFYIMFGLSIALTYFENREIQSSI